MKLQRLLLLFLLAASLFPAAHAFAQAKKDQYPTRPVRMIVPFAPGGASDTVGRIIQPAMADLLQQQVVVDNRGGAAGNIGVEVAVRATPDGYTFLLGNIGTMAINPNYYTKFKYRPLKDLIPITQVVDVPGSFVVHPSVPAKSVKELIAHMKSNPGKLNYGAAAPSSANTLEMIQYLRATGTDAVQVAYKGGAGPAMIGLLANEVQLMMVTFSSAVNFAKQGRVRMLAVISPERNPAYPEIPTMREQGLDMAVGSWQGLFVPQGTPKAVVNRLFQVGTGMMKDPRVTKRLGDSGITIVTSKSPADFVTFVKAETARFGKVIKDANIRTD
ncbi:MAG TPA: tripartite tricarboxylate transporter substrate binding protein [Burkholderiales bacterium]|nr:tripartite tricarboxylate transporter substrate binding protein [Burkholderiales bacterium]